MKDFDDFFAFAALTNRGVQNANIDNIKVLKVPYSSLNIDFFTCTIKEHKIDEVLTWFNYDKNTAILIENRGLFGYKKCYLIHQKCYIYFDNEHNNDIMLWFSGRACREIYAYHDWKELFKFISKYDYFNNNGELIRNFNISRIDLATDFYNLKYDLINKLKKECCKGNFTSKFKTRVVFEKFNNDDNKFLGNSVRFGSMGSDISIIFYDKVLEREHADYDVSEDIKTWYRMEVNYRGEHAMEVYNQLVNNYDNIGKFNSEVINYYLNFKKPNKNDYTKSRWLTALWWTKLLNTVNKQKLTPYTINSSIMKKRQWLRHSSSKALLLCYLDDNKVFKRLLIDGYDKMKISDYHMLKEHLLERYINEDIIMYNFIKNMELLDFKEYCKNLIKDIQSNY